MHISSIVTEEQAWPFPSWLWLPDVIGSVCLVCVSTMRSLPELSWCTVLCPSTSRLVKYLCIFHCSHKKYIVLSFLLVLLLCWLHFWGLLFLSVNTVSLYSYQGTYKIWKMIIYSIGNVWKNAGLFRLVLPMGDLNDIVLQNACC